MKKKWIVLLFTVLLIQGCAAPAAFESKNDADIGTTGNLNIYISANGDLFHAKGKLDADSFNVAKKAESFGIRKKRDIISEIENDANGNVYCSITTSNGVSFGEIVYVVKENNIKEIVNVGEEFGASTLLKNDDSIYVQGAVVPANEDSQGVPFVKISVDNLSTEFGFNVKGIVSADATYNNDIYMFVIEAEKVGYSGFNECYLAKYDYKKGTLEIINDDVKAANPRSMVITEDGKIFVVDTPMFTDEEKSSHLYEYDVTGAFIDKFELDNWADRIVLDGETAYISHRGKNELYDDAGETVSVFDLKTGKCLSKLQVGRGPADLKIYNGVLFVGTYTDSTVEAIDTKTGNCIGKMQLEDTCKIDQIIITNN